MKRGKRRESKWDSVGVMFPSFGDGMREMASEGGCKARARDCLSKACLGSIIMVHMVNHVHPGNGGQKNPFCGIQIAT